MSVLQGSVRAAPSQHDLMPQSDSPSHYQPLFLSYPQTLTNTKRYASPHFFFSSASPLLPFSSLLSSTRLPNPKQFPQTSGLTPYRNLNIEFPLFLLHGFHLKPWPWRLERTKRSGSLGWLHAISYSFSNLNQTSFIYAFSSLNYNMRWDLQRVCLYHLLL